MPLQSLMISMSRILAQIPVIDFEPFLQGEFNAKQKVAAQIYQACQEIGFVYLQNFGVSSTLIHQLFDQAKQFFNLPLVVKNQKAWSEKTNSGYVGFQKERTNPNRPFDLKEAFDFGKPVVESLGDEENEEFSQIVSEFYKVCTTEVAPKILRAFALALQLPEDFFVERHKNSYFLRLLHYPPVNPAPQPGQIRAGEHTDFGSITLLFPEEIDGLEIYTNQGEWLAAPQLPDTLLVNVGDSMQQWTNNKLHSTLHRVVNPAEANSQKSRYSIALFCGPDPQVELACLESCQEPGQVPLYSPVLAGDYIQSRLRSLYE